MSIASLLKSNFIEGGPVFMTLYLIFWIFVIVSVIRFILNFKSKNRNLTTLKKFNSTIFFIGSFALLFSIFYWMMGLYSALQVAQTTSDISPVLFIEGLRVSLIAPLYSLFLFLFTSTIWFIQKNKIRV